MQNTLTPADVILQQLGGNRILTMLGATAQRDGENTLLLRIKARAANQARTIKITWDPGSDDYTVVFEKAVTRANMFRQDLKDRIFISRFPDVYAHDLKSVLEEQLQLRISL